MIRPPPRSTPFPYTPLSRSRTVEPAREFAPPPIVPLFCVGAPELPQPAASWLTPRHVAAPQSTVPPRFARPLEGIVTAHVSTPSHYQTSHSGFSLKTIAPVL